MYRPYYNEYGREVSMLLGREGINLPYLSIKKTAHYN